MFRSKVEVTLRHMRLPPLILRPSDDPAAVLAAGHPLLIIIDLSLGAERWREIVAAVRATPSPAPVLAFGPHVDHDTHAAARAAGCDLVVANSRLTRELPELVERLLGQVASD
jgi:DNA-binding NarL/FixJ family response regulator